MVGAHRPVCFVERDAVLHFCDKTLQTSLSAQQQPVRNFHSGGHVSTHDVFLPATEKLPHCRNVFEQKQVAAIARIVTPLVPVGAVTITRRSFAYKASVEHQRQALVEPLGNVVRRAPPADTFQQFDMAHFVGDHVGIRALGIQDHIGTAPRRANAAPSALGAAAIFLVLLRCLADDDFRIGFFALIKRINACLGERDGAFKGFVFVSVDIRAEIDLFIRRLEIGECDELAVEDLRVEEKEATQQDY